MRRPHRPASTPRTRLPALLTLLTLALSACGQTGTAPTAPAPTAPAQTLNTAALPADYQDREQDFLALTDAQNELATQTLGTPSAQLLGTLPWTNASNGWGPVERNMSNGEQAAGDGRTITLAGRSYASGLGVHAPSDVSYALDGSCQGLKTDIGIDQETAGLGHAQFQIWADGQKLYDSGPMSAQSPTLKARAFLYGRHTLRLVVQGGPAGNDFAHADWADAQLIPCPARTPTASATASATAGATAPVYSAPLIITKGGTYTGHWETKDPAVPALSIQTSEPVIIENSSLKGVGGYGLIMGFHNRLTVRNTTFTGMRPAGSGKGVPHALNLGQVYNLTVEHNHFDHTAGVYVNEFQGNSSAGETIKVRYNLNTNSDGRLSDGLGGYLKTDRQVVNFLMFNHVQAPGSEISWNEDVNTPYQSLVEDNVNMYVSGGTLAQPILIHDNYVQGAYGIDPANDTSFYGGGIIIGDGPTERPEQSGHIRVYHNQIVGTVNYGLGIVGGSDQQIYENRVISSGLLPDGRVLGYTNVGLMVWNYAHSTPDLYFGNESRNNYSVFTHRNADGSVASNNPWWFNDCLPGGCQGNTSAPSATLQDEQNERTSWKSKLQTANISVGVH